MNLSLEHLAGFLDTVVMALVPGIIQSGHMPEQVQYGNFGHPLVNKHSSLMKNLQKIMPLFYPG
jgi:hypothetical protein